MEKPVNFPELILSERKLMVDTLRELKPVQWQSDTLCEGWSVADLVAHILERERGGLLSRVGILVPPLNARHERGMQKRQKIGHDGMIEQLALPPFWVPRLKYNLIEFFVHNEDLLRGKLQRSRRVSPEIERGLYDFMPGLARLAFRTIKEDLQINIIDENTRDVIEINRGQGADKPTLRLVGAPGEFVLLFMGRGRQAKIEVSGDKVAREIYRDAQIGI